tara:strand:+ start:168 stop:347 length:180 start_codon:yes stop_codon:yes gene_type:complete
MKTKIKLLIIAVAIVALNSCTLTLDADGKPIFGADNEAINRAIKVGVDKANDSLREASK